MHYFAHSIPEVSEKNWHQLKDHLIDTGRLTAGSHPHFGLDNWRMSPDYSTTSVSTLTSFQLRLRGAPLQVDHSTAGAQEAVRLYGPAVGRILAYIVAGHHVGLPDFGPLSTKVRWPPGSRRLSRITVLTARRLARGFQISWWGSFQPSPTPKDRGLLCNFSSACYFRALSTLTISIPSRRCSPGKLKRDVDIRHCLSSKSVLTPLWKHHSVKLEPTPVNQLRRRNIGERS